MGKTMAEKILGRASGGGDVKAGDIVWAHVDKAMMDDILGPRIEIADGMKDICDEIWDPGKVVIISDHYTPPAGVKQAEIVRFTRLWAKEHGVEHYYEYTGPCHQVMAENGHILPGTLVLGTDSHTCTGGALGAFACGVGSTEMLGILVTGKTWLKVPETIKVNWSGSFRAGVMAKDAALRTIGTIGHAGATYKAVEFLGSAIGSMIMDERMAISNMAVEMGAKAGLIPPDDQTRAFLAKYAPGRTGYPVLPDPGAEYDSVFDFNADILEPMLACPHTVDNVKPVSEERVCAIDQAYLGSCTGGRYNDLAVAAKILKGRRIAKGVRMLVSPASQTTWIRAAEDGTLGVLAEAGAMILAPTCGVCVGLHSGILAAGETCVSSSNRNFIGRMGSKDASVYLGSPATVAASAVTGFLTDPREFS